jgi:microcystin-dependent protein
MARRDYTGGAPSTTLGAGITSTATTITIADATGWPSGANGEFFCVIDRGNASEEKILVESRSGTTLTLASSAKRGVDGTTAAAHSSGATIEHCLAATDLDEPNAHINDTNLDHHTQYLNTSRHASTTHTASMLGTDAVTTVKIQDDAVTQAKIADNAVGADQIAANAVGSSEIAAGAVTWSKLAATVLPAGTIMDYAGSGAVPSGWLACDGAAVSRTTYATLFAAIGTTWGAGDGATTFNTPDLRGRTTISVDGAAGRITDSWADTVGQTGGAATHTLVTDEIPAHSHAIAARPDDATSSGSYYPTSEQTTQGVQQVNTNNQGGGGAHNNVQPTATVQKIICTGGV